MGQISPNFLNGGLLQLKLKYGILMILIETMTERQGI